MPPTAADERAEAEPEGEQVDRRVEDRRERRRLPERLEVRHVAAHHAGRSAPARAGAAGAGCGRGARRGDGGRRAHSTSSPVSSTKTSSSEAARRTPSGSEPLARLGAEDRDRGAGAADAEARASASSRTSASRARRPVDLERLAPGVLAHERGRPALARRRLPVGHDRHRVGEPLGLLDVVRRHQDRRALAAQRVDQRPQLLADLRVEPDGRLVEQQQPRPVHERAGDQQPPAHPAGELVARRVGALGEVRDLQRAVDRGAALVARDAVQAREDGEVLARRELDVEVVELGTTPHCARACLESPGTSKPSTLDLARVGDRLRGEHLHRRRLAGAVRPEQADAGALGHVEVEPVDRGDVAEALGHAPEPDGERFRHVPQHDGPLGHPAGCVP